MAEKLMNIEMTEQKITTTRNLSDDARQRGRAVSREYIRRLCADGQLKARKVGRDWLIELTAAEEWLLGWLKE